MKSTSKKLSTSVEFTVEFDQKDFEPARLKALERLARNIKVPGFRNGKAPANVVEQHVDPNDLASQTLDIVVRQAIPKLFNDEGLTPVSIPHVDVMKYVPGEMAELTITADIMPEVKLGDYENVKVVYDEPEVTDKDVEDVLHRIAESYAEPKVVKRAAKKGDEVIIDFKGKKDGKAFDGGSAKDYHLRLGSGQFIPGFEDGIVGHEVGDKFDLDITFPKDYASKELAGAKTVFEILVKQVSEIETPKIDDNLAQKSGAFKTLKELREDIMKNLKSRASYEADEKYKDTLLNEIISHSKTEAPASLVQEQFESMKEDMFRNLRSHGMEINQYLEQTKQKLEDWEADLREAARKRVIGSIVVQKLADVLGIEVSEEEAAQQVVEMRAVYKNDPKALEQLNNPEVATGIRNRMRVDKTMNKLVEINKPHAKKPAKKAATKKSAKK
ncbi:trigger factor [Candidatus Saccharibacteria bacterium]|nr:trigger factor [Candidatus Saccharibacteria bacterium]